MKNGEAIKFFTKLAVQNHGNEEVDFPQYFTFKFSGNDNIDVFYTEINDTKYTPILRVDQAQFKPRD